MFGKLANLLTRQSRSIRFINWMSNLNVQSKYFENFCATFSKRHIQNRIIRCTETQVLQIKKLQQMPNVLVRHKFGN